MLKHITLAKVLYLSILGAFCPTGQPFTMSLPHHLILYMCLIFKQNTFIYLFIFPQNAP